MATGDGSQLSELRDLIARLAGREGDQQTAIASLYLVRYSLCLSPDFGVLTPGLCIVAQGQKELLMSDEVYANTPGHYVVASAEIPVSARVVGATRSKPYLGLRLDLDLTSLRSLMEEARLPSPVAGAPARGLYVSPTAPSLLDAALRLVRLLQSPAEIPVLAPMIEREILFRLLLDESRVVLHRIAQADSPPQRISIAIVWLRKPSQRLLAVQWPPARVRRGSSS